MAIEQQQIDYFLVFYGELDGAFARHGDAPH
jgi:hypothetical protein